MDTFYYIGEHYAADMFYFPIFETCTVRWYNWLLHNDLTSQHQENLKTVCLPPLTVSMRMTTSVVLSEFGKRYIIAFNL